MESTLSLVFCIHLTQRHRVVNTVGELWPYPEDRIKRFGEAAVERVDECRCIQNDSVEGYSASRPVQIHSHSVRGGSRFIYDPHWVIMPCRIIISRAVQTPGDVVPTNTTVNTSTTPFNPSVSHSYRHQPTPVHLPVTVTSQATCTHQLVPALKPLRVIWIQPFLVVICHKVVFWQVKVPVYCVQVHFEFTGVWRQNENRTVRTVHRVEHGCQSDHMTASPHRSHDPEQMNPLLYQIILYHSFR